MMGGLGGPGKGVVGGGAAASGLGPGGTIGLVCIMPTLALLLRERGPPPIGLEGRGDPPGVKGR
jgi:hypothetical protein